MPAAYPWRIRAPSRTWAHLCRQRERCFWRAPDRARVDTEDEVRNNSKRSGAQVQSGQCRSNEVNGSKGVFVDVLGRSAKHPPLSKSCSTFPNDGRCVDQPRGSSGGSRLGGHAQWATESPLNSNMEYNLHTGPRAQKHGQRYLARWRPMLESEDSNSVIGVLEQATAKAATIGRPSLHHVVLLQLVLRPKLTPHLMRSILAYLDALLKMGQSGGKAIMPLDAQLVHDFVSSDHAEDDRLFWRRHRSIDCLIPWDMSAIFRIYSNLMCHARKAWPLALETITLSLLGWLTLLKPSMSSTWSQQRIRLGHHSPLLQTSDALAKQDLAALTFVANATLQLLAAPSASQPYKNSTIQEKAQICVVHFMVDHTPPLELDRNGYRAIASVQLMLPKTQRELQWTELQSLSWPPWKQDRTAMDSRIGPEHGRSNALQVLMRMKDAGYRPRGWENAAEVYTGWDLDGSPTVQTRQYLGSFSDWQTDIVLWAARIRTTRTLREAWAAFLVFWNSGIKWRGAVCQAMLERILNARKREMQTKADARNESRFEGSQSLVSRRKVRPGEGREIWPSPPSSHLETYTRTPPPTLSEFLQLMRQRQVTLDDDALGYLATLVTQWDDANLLLQHFRPNATRLGPSDIAMLFQVRRPANFALGRLMVQHLLHFPRQSEWKYPRDGVTFKVGPVLLNNTALGLAYSILVRKETESGDLSSHFFLHLNRQVGLTPNRPLEDRDLESCLPKLVNVRETYGKVVAAQVQDYMAHIDRMVAFRMALRVCAAMQDRQETPGHKSIVNVLSIGFKAAQAARHVAVDIGHQISKGDQIQLSGETVKVLMDETQHCQQSVVSGVRPLLFELLQTKQAVPPNTHLVERESTSHPPDSDHAVASTAFGIYRSAQATHPRVTTAPSPVILHAAIRCFGAADDFAGISQIVHYMQEYWPEVEAATKQDRNGRAMLRLAFSAINLFLTLGSDAARRDLSNKEVVALFVERHKRQEYKADQITVDQVLKVAETMGTQWGGWPLPMEVEAYIMKRKDETNS